MPPYQTLTLPPALSPGDSYTVWNNELLTLLQTSEQIALVPKEGAPGTTYKVKIVFASAPGASPQFDVQEADGSETPSDYSVAPNGSLQSVDAGTGTTMLFEGTLNNAKWVRIMPRAFANIGTVKVTATILR